MLLCPRTLIASLEMRTALRSSFYDVGLESRAPTERRHGIMLSSEEMPLLLLFFPQGLGHNFRPQCGADGRRALTKRPLEEG